jgi:hypothetical protein
MPTASFDTVSLNHCFQFAHPTRSVPYATALRLGARPASFVNLTQSGPRRIPALRRSSDILPLLDHERSHTLTLDTILAALKAEREKIARAIAALQEGTARAATARRAVAPAATRTRRRRRLSAEARQRLSEFKKRWWAKKKRQRKAR